MEDIMESSYDPQWRYVVTDIDVFTGIVTIQMESNMGSQEERESAYDVFANLGLGDLCPCNNKVDTAIVTKIDRIALTWMCANAYSMGTLHNFTDLVDVVRQPGYKKLNKSRGLTGIDAESGKEWCP